MASRIRLFRSVHKYQRWMGIFSTKLNEPTPFNGRNSFFIISLTHFWIPPFLFFAFKASSFKDYADCLYAFTTSFACYSHYIVQMIYITNFVSLTKNYEKFIEHSKYKNAYLLLYANVQFIFSIFYSRSEQKNTILCQIE